MFIIAKKLPKNVTWGFLLFTCLHLFASMPHFHMFVVICHYSCCYVRLVEIHPI